MNVFVDIIRDIIAVNWPQYKSLDEFGLKETIISIYSSRMAQIEFNMPLDRTCSLTIRIEMDSQDRPFVLFVVSFTQYLPKNLRPYGHRVYTMQATNLNLVDTMLREIYGYVYANKTDPERATMYEFDERCPTCVERLVKFRD